jgi:hypothetical protein
MAARSFSLMPMLMVGAEVLLEALAMSFLLERAG